jgi:chromosome segregation ATPase
MKLERLVHDVESRLGQLGRVLWDPDSRLELKDEIALLSAQLADREAALERARAERESTARRISDNEVAAALLPTQVENSVRRKKTSQAFRQALELDRIRRTLAEDQANLPRLERQCSNLEFHITLLQRRLARLRQQLRSQA